MVACFPFPVAEELKEWLHSKPLSLLKTNEFHSVASEISSSLAFFETTDFVFSDYLLSSDLISYLVSLPRFIWTECCLLFV